MLRSSIFIIIALLLSGCQVVIETQNRYPGQPLPEEVAPPRNLTVSLLQVFGGRSPEVAHGIYRVHGVFIRPVNVRVRNMSQGRWRALRTSLQIDGDAVATCALHQGGYVPLYVCDAPNPPRPHHYYGRHY